MGLGGRLAIVFATVAAATALLVGGASYVTTNRQVTAEVDNFLEKRAGEITGGLRDQPSGRHDNKRGDDRNDTDDDEGDNIIVAVTPDAEVQILDTDGTVISNTGLLLPVDDIDRELAEFDERAVLRTVAVGESDFRMITAHLPDGGAVQVARSLDESTSLLGVLQTRILWIAGLVGLAGAVVGWVVAQHTTRPLRALTTAVDEVAATRDFAVPLPSSGSDEVGRLTRGFNRMLGALRLSQEQQRRLVQDAAHELRTPLTSVTANVEWLMRAPDLDADERAETLAGVRRELGELNDLMNEIVQLATDSHEPSTMAPTELGPVVADAVERFRRRSGREVTVTGEAVTVLGDADALDRAVTNLLSNADKYSPATGAVAVEFGPDGVFVDDAGPGIPVDERGLVFERFYRRAEDRSRPGSGLGLAIVADIVEQHGGEVYVGDSPLGGTRVGFVLPHNGEPRSR